MNEPQISSETTVVEIPTTEMLEEPLRRFSLTVRSFGLTDRGKVRETSEPGARRKSF